MYEDEDLKKLEGEDGGKPGMSTYSKVMVWLIGIFGVAAIGLGVYGIVIGKWF